MSKRMTVLTAAAGAAIGAAGALYYALLRRPLAQTKGSINLPGLQGSVQIIRDRWGIPHIYADNPHDLFFAQGFVHAQDRFFQMDYQRRAFAGTVSELVGPAGLASDVQLRTLGIKRAAEASLPLQTAMKYFPEDFT